METKVKCLGNTIRELFPSWLLVEQKFGNNSRFDIFGDVLREVVCVLEDVVHGEAPRCVVHLLVSVHLKLFIKFYITICLLVQKLILNSLIEFKSENKKVSC